VRVTEKGLIVGKEKGRAIRGKKRRKESGSGERNGVR
jgi:hypothetical protein